MGRLLPARRRPFFVQQPVMADPNSHTGEEDDLQSMIRKLHSAVNELCEEVADLETEGGKPDRLLTRQETADKLRISTSTLDDLRAMDEIKATKIRGRVLYHPDTVEAYVRKHTS